MPVRSLHSSILVWPSVSAVRSAARAWAAVEVPRHTGLTRLGYYGSYARGDAGVGSDLDLFAIIASSADAFERRGLRWGILELPVPASIVVYTAAEWERMRAAGGRFARTVEREAVWLFTTA